MSLVKKISSGRREAKEPRLCDPRVLPCLYRLGGAAGDLRNCSGLTSVGGTGVLSVTWGHVLAVVRVMAVFFLVVGQLLLATKLNKTTGE